MTTQSGTVPVSEAFGPVWQGEGPFTGRVAHFLRLGNCNLGCTWCDSAYTWNGTEKFDGWDATRLSAWAQEVDEGGGILVLTGGEPLLHQTNPVLQEGLEDTRLLHVETNGTITPNSWALGAVDHFAVSPKLAPQGDPAKRRLKHAPLVAFAKLAQQGRASFKIVCGTPADVADAAQFMNNLGVPAAGQWIMPLGFERADMLNSAHAIADAVAEHGMNLTLRQHVVLYGTERNR